MSGPTPAKALEILKRRQIVAARYIDGQAQHEIATALEVTQRTITRDLAAIREDWKQSALLDFNAKQAEEIARINDLERMYRRAWKRSTKPRTTSENRDMEEELGTGEQPADSQASEDTSHEPGNDEPEPRPPGLHRHRSRRFHRESVQTRDGNPAFLQGIAWCIDRRCRILGLDARDGAAGRSSQQVAITLVEVVRPPSELPNPTEVIDGKSLPSPE